MAIFRNLLLTPSALPELGPSPDSLLSGYGSSLGLLARPGPKQKNEASVAIKNVRSFLAAPDQ